MVLKFKKLQILDNAWHMRCRNFFILRNSLERFCKMKSSDCVRPLRLKPTRLRNDFKYQMLLCELITVTRMIPLHLRSRLVSAKLTYAAQGL